MTTPSVAEVVARLRNLILDDAFPEPVEKEVLDAATLLESEHAARVEAERKAAYWNERFEFQCKMGDKAGMDLYSAMMRAESAERELATLRNRPCPYVHSSGEGTHYCTLPHVAEKELAELRKRVAEAPRVTFRLGYAEGLFEVDSAQEDHLVPTGQRVAIVPLGEGE